MKTVFLALLLLFSFGVSAEPYVFVTGSGAQIKAKVGEGLSESTRALSIVGGYRLNKHFAAEADYLLAGRVLGEDADRFQGSSRFTTSHLYEVNGFGLSAIGMWPVSERISVLGKLGAHYLRLEHTTNALEFSATTNSLIRSTSSTTVEQVLVPSIALGAEFSAAREVQLRLMLEQVIGRGTLDRMRLLSASIVFSF